MPGIYVPPIGGVPVVIAASPNTGSFAGGTVVTVQVDDSTGATGATIGGLALTGFSITDATHVQGTTQAHVSGVVNVTVTNGFGTGTLVGGFTYTFNPITDTAPAAFYVRPNYSVAGSTGTWVASAGTNVANASGTAPTAAAGGPDVVNTVSQYLTNAVPISAFVGSGSHHFYATAVAEGLTSAAVIYSAHAIITDSGQYIGLFVRRSSGTVGIDAAYELTFYEWDTGVKVATVPLSSVDINGNGSFTVQGKKEGGILYVRLNGGAWSAGDPCGATGDPSGTLQICGGGFSNEWEGKIIAVGTWTAPLSSTVSDELAAWTPP